MDDRAQKGAKESSIGDITIAAKGGGEYVEVAAAITVEIVPEDEGEGTLLVVFRYLPNNLDQFATSSRTNWACWDHVMGTQ